MKQNTEKLGEINDSQSGRMSGFKFRFVETYSQLIKSFARLSSEKHSRMAGLGVLGAAIGLQQVGWWGAAPTGLFFWMCTACYYIYTEGQQKIVAEKILPFQPYATLGLFIRWFPHVVGCVAFTALFASAMDFTDKVFFGSAFILFLLWRDISELTSSILKDEQNSLAWMQILTLEKSLKGEAINWKEALEKHRTQELTTAKWTTGDGSEIVAIFLLRYVFWVLCGWVFSKVTAVL